MIIRPEEKLNIRREMCVLLTFCDYATPLNIISQHKIFIKSLFQKCFIRANYSIWGSEPHLMRTSYDISKGKKRT